MYGIHRPTNLKRPGLLNSMVSDYGLGDRSSMADRSKGFPSMAALRSTEPLIHWVPGVLSPGLKRGKFILERCYKLLKRLYQHQTLITYTYLQIYFKTSFLHRIHNTQGITQHYNYFKLSRPIYIYIYSSIYLFIGTA